jgi:DNA-binding winged helix-turn-helix (wHTH) protein
VPANGLECRIDRARVGPTARAPRCGDCVTYRFGQFALDTPTRQLLGDDREIRLSPKAFDLLCALVRNRNRAMSRAELHQLLWPTTFVLETNLASLVAEIRRALGDTADAPRFVRTMHRFGYWFIGDVDDAEAIEAPVGTVNYWVVWDGRQVRLIDGDNVLGRAPDAAVWIDAPGVSRHHARIVISGGRATVEDLASKNGTFVRDRRVGAPLVLCDGDQIRLGSVVITFRIPPATGSTESVSVR